MPSFKSRHLMFKEKCCVCQSRYTGGHLLSRTNRQRYHQKVINFMETNTSLRAQNITTPRLLGADEKREISSKKSHKLRWEEPERGPNQDIDSYRHCVSEECYVVEKRKNVLIRVIPLIQCVFPSSITNFTRSTDKKRLIVSSGSNSRDSGLSIPQATRTRSGMTNRLIWIVDPTPTPNAKSNLPL